MRQGNLAGHYRVIVGHIGMRVNQPVLQLNIHPPPELLDIKLAPINAQGFPDSFGFLGGEVLFSPHINLLKNIPGS
jgi:hypothetical protein